MTEVMKYPRGQYDQFTSYLPYLYCHPADGYNERLSLRHAWCWVLFIFFRATFPIFTSYLQTFFLCAIQSWNGPVLIKTCSYDWFVRQLDLIDSKVGQEIDMVSICL
jgi:hypothetical protein